MSNTKTKAPLGSGADKEGQDSWLVDGAFPWCLRVTERARQDWDIAQLERIYFPFVIPWCWIERQRYKRTQRGGGVQTRMNKTKMRRRSRSGEGGWVAGAEDGEEGPGRRQFFADCFKHAQISFMRALLSRPKHFPKTLLPSSLK